MVDVFGDGDRRNQILAWDAALDQVLGRGRPRHLALAGAAGGVRVGA